MDVFQTFKNLIKVCQNNKKIISLLVVFSFVGLNSEPKKKEEPKPPTAWVIDCKERKDCFKNCMEMRVLHGRWGGQEYENSIKVECVRTCQQSILCIKNEE